MKEKEQQDQKKELPSDGPVILHLSDLHFGCDNTCQSEVDRSSILDGLIRTISQVDACWKPTIICITGDIAWRGEQKDYILAKEWIDQLLIQLNLTYSQVVLCPGNHDSIRQKAAGLIRPNRYTDADRVLTLDHYKLYETPFSEYIDFCKICKIEPFKLYDKNSFLMGEKSINGIRFIACNSAWFCQGNDDRGNLWVGLELLKAMKLPMVGDSDCGLTVALVHHPREFLKDEEFTPYPGRPGTIYYLAERSHLILSGHTHGEPVPPDTIGNRALHIRVGSTYRGPRYPNNVCLVKIDNDGIDYYYFRIEAGSSSYKWDSIEPAERVEFPWRIQSSGIRIKPEKSESLEDVDSKVHSVKAYKDNIENRIKEIEENINEFEFNKAFKSASILSEYVTSHEQYIPKETLIEVYILLGEVTRTKIRHEYIMEGKPEDFSQVEYYLEKAKNVQSR